jgi:hypothetical protein
MFKADVEGLWVKFSSTDMARDVGNLEGWFLLAKVDDCKLTASSGVDSLKYTGYCSLLSVRL